MNRNDLKERYNIFGENKDIAVFERKRPYGNGVGYLGNIVLSNGSAKFNGKTYKSIDELDSAMREWGNGLEWPVDTYCPIYREQYKILNRIGWYLESKLGFKYKCGRDGWDGGAYTREIGPGYSIRVRVLECGDEINVASTYAGMTFTTKVPDAETAVASISHIVRSEILMMAKDMVEALSALPETDVADIEMFVDSKKSLFGFERVDFKSTMIGLLEDELKALKGE